MYDRIVLQDCRIDSLPTSQDRSNFLTGDSLEEVCKFYVLKEYAFRLTELFMKEMLTSSIDSSMAASVSIPSLNVSTDMLRVRVEWGMAENEV